MRSCLTWTVRSSIPPPAFSIHWKKFSAPWALTSPGATLAATSARPSAKASASIAKIEEATKRYRVSYAAKGCHEGDVYPGVVEMLGRLKAAGLTLCTATCKPTDVVRPILEEQGLAPYFSFVGGASMDESRDNKTDVIRHVLAQPVMQGKRVLMVGDRRDDMQGAVNCGLDAAAVLYGYGGREEVAPFAPVFMAADCKELTDWALRPVDEPSHS